jgi:hypothetical protein
MLPAGRTRRLAIRTDLANSPPDFRGLYCAFQRIRRLNDPSGTPQVYYPQSQLILRIFGFVFVKLRFRGGGPPMTVSTKSSYCSHLWLPLRILSETINHARKPPFSWSGLSQGVMTVRFDCLGSPRRRSLCFSDGTLYTCVDAQPWLLFVRCIFSRDAPIRRAKRSRTRSSIAFPRRVACIDDRCCVVCVDVFGRRTTGIPVTDKPADECGSPSIELIAWMLSFVRAWLFSRVILCRSIRRRLPNVQVPDPLQYK